jgi:hypothetical protein
MFVPNPDKDHFAGPARIYLAKTRRTPDRTRENGFAWKRKARGFETQGFETQDLETQD